MLCGSRIMSAQKISPELLKSKFRGCLAGVLLGDCIGNVWEDEFSEHLKTLDGPEVECELSYSDDSVMTRSIAESLIENGKLDEKDIAKRFTNVYYEDADRGYGPDIHHVFAKWRSSDFADLWTPAKEQFAGEGSFGNGGAMRIAPVALFCLGNYDQLLSTVTSVTKLTHTNPLAICGALFQSIAIQQALELDPAEKLDEKLFLKNLKDKIGAIEENIYANRGFGLGNFWYQEKIDSIEELLERSRREYIGQEIITTLGNSVNALHSVPTALFCFLRSLQEIPHIKTDNPMRRTIEYAMFLGGDTDTIGSMAAAIMGSYFGEEVVPPFYLKHVETGMEMPLLGEKLYDIVAPSLRGVSSAKCDPM